MNLVFRLPFLLLEAVLRRSAEILGGIVAAVRGEEPLDAPIFTERPAPAPPPRPTAAAPTPGPTAEEAIERRFEREAAAAAEPPPTPPTPIGAAGHVDRGAAIVESFGDPDEVGAAIEVDEPWPGYASEPASAIVARLRDADPAIRAVARLYEQRHKRRATVLRAT